MSSYATGKAKYVQIHLDRLREQEIELNRQPWVIAMKLRIEKPPPDGRGLG